MLSMASVSEPKAPAPVQPTWQESGQVLKKKSRVSSPPHQEYCRDGGEAPGTPDLAMVFSLQFAVLT